MGQAYGVDELRSIVNRTIAPKARWVIMTWPIESTSDPVASGIADTYKLACAAAGEAFDRLTAPQVDQRPVVVKALAEALRVYRECVHRESIEVVMAAAIAAYEKVKSA